MFQKAVKSESKLKMAIEGVSGSGKTFTALTIATALGKTAVLDTESGSASKYADRFSFDVVNMTAPYTPARYVEIINAAANAGYEVLVIDSLSHAWFADGGVLDIVDKAARRSQSKNTYVAWAEGTPAHNALINAIVAAPIHIIGTMRSKSDYIMVDNGRGKEAPKKVGMAPIQRDGFEYEFDVTAKMTIDNELMIEKTRLFSLQGLVMSKPTAELAQLIKADLSGQPDDRPRYANHVLVDGAALPFYNDYMKAHDAPPATADDLREWYKASKAKQAAQPAPEATATAVPLIDTPAAKVGGYTE